MRARSRSSISAMTCLPERLIVRSSSSSAVDAVAREAAVARERRRLVDERALDRVAHVGEIVELGDERADERRLQLGEHGADARHDRERLLQADEIARAGRAERGARDQPLEVLNGLERLAELAALGRPERELLDGVEPIADRLERRRAAAAATTRSSRLPIDVTVRSSSSSSDPSRPPSEPSTTSRCLSVVGSMSSASARCAVRDGAHVREVDLLRVAQVVDERAGGRDGGGLSVEAEAFEAAGAQLIEQRAARRLRRRTSSASTGVIGQPARERSVGELARPRRRRPAGHDDLARLEDGELVGQRLQAVGAGVLGRRELAGREVEQRHADRRRSPSARPPPARSPSGTPARARRGSPRRSACPARRRGRPRA